MLDWRPLAALVLAALPSAASAQSLPDATLTDAAGALLNANPVLGAFIIGLAATLWWREKVHREDTRTEREAHAKALEREQDAHQKTREAWLADVKEYAAIGETVRDQMRSMVSIVQGAVDLMRERGRT